MMKFGKQGPESIPQHSGMTIIERNLTRAGIYPRRFLRPRITLPDFPLPPLSEALPKDGTPLPKEKGIDNDPTDPKLIRDSPAAQIRTSR